MLSDACFEFLEAVREAAKKLAEDVHYYSDPNSPLGYGSEIEALRLACRKVAPEVTFDVEPLKHLIQLSATVLRYHDTLPNSPNFPVVTAEMAALIRLLQDNLGAEDAAAAPAVVRDLVREQPSGEQAAQTTSRFKAMLSRLGKSSYDVAVKIAGDVASATIKKDLGL